MNSPANPYLDEFFALGGKLEPLDDWHFLRDDFESSFRRTRARHALVRQYAWAIPSEAALDLLARYAPLIEIGAGTGYWAHLLREREVEILAYDRFPPDGEREQGYHSTHPAWTEVLEGGVEMAASAPERTLFLCWPPYATSMAREALESYAGKHVVYIGEGEGGCTGDDSFFEKLDAEFEVIESLPLPQWDGLHDGLWVYRRK